MSRTPISVDELLAKQRKEKEESAKPKFLTKAERAAIALAKRAAEVEAGKEKELALRQKRDELDRRVRVSETPSSHYSSGGGGQHGELDYGRGDARDRGSYQGRGGSRGGPRGRNGLGYRGNGRGQYDDCRDVRRDDRRDDNRDDRSRDDRRSEHSRDDRPPPPSAPAAMLNGSNGQHADRSVVSATASMDLDQSGATGSIENGSTASGANGAAEENTRPASGLDAASAAESSVSATGESSTIGTSRGIVAASQPTAPPPGVKLTLAEMAAMNAASPAAIAPAPLNQQLNATRYLGARAPDKRKIRKQSDKKFNFDWEQQDDTGLNEVDPIFAPYIPPVASSSGKGDRGDRSGNKGKQSVVAPIVQGQMPRFGLFGRGVLAGFDRDIGPGSEKKAKGAIDERHWTDKTLAEMRERDWRIFREDFSIAARGGNIPLPLRSWQESTIPQQILDAIAEVGYTEPSPIQRQAIPVGLQNRDMIGIAETGSGKTAAFVVPMLAYISRLPPLSDENRGKGPYALVLAPTRELAQQIESETNKFCKVLGYTCVSIVGGRAIEEQQFNMRFGAEIVIATPGRLKDCIERHVLVLGQCTYVVMDEADRMVSLGFEDVINYILDSMPLTNLKPDTEEAEDGTLMTMEIKPPEGLEDQNSTLALYRQTVMFSATMPAAVERLAKKYLRRPAIVTIGVAGQAVDTVDQRVEFISTEDKKKARLIDILNNGGFEPPIIVFVNQKKSADGLMKDIQRAHWSATTLHSGKNQEQREAALNSIRSGECDILVATDLAGRGIDVPDVSLVINYQMSNTIEAYIHRIGRTGRAGKTGVAVTFLNDGDEELMYDLKQEISKSPVSRCPPELLKHPAAQTKMSGAMKRQRDIED